MKKLLISGNPIHFTIENVGDVFEAQCSSNFRNGNADGEG